MASSSSSSPEYVGFWKRLLAFLIDTLIVMVVLVPLLMLIYGTQFFDIARQMQGQAGGGRIADGLIDVALAVVGILFWRYRGATPGKMAVAAKIVDASTGGPPSTGRLILRFFAYLVSALPLMLGFAWIAVDRRKQGFHDKIAGTVVVYDDD